MKLPIKYGRQSISQEDIKAVTEVLQSDFLTQGPKVAEFEKNFAEYVGSKYAVAVANGTAALHICTLALGVNETSRVITTPVSFVATANAVKFCGGKVYFADIDSNTFCLDPEKVEAMIASKPKGFFSGIIPVDFAGYAVDMEAFRKIADEHDLWLIEDAAHAPGAFFKNASGIQCKSGSGEYADLSIFSFHPVKHIACGEGGMVTTNDEKLYKRLLKFRSHGITAQSEDLQNDIQVALGQSFHESESTGDFPGWYMEMQDLGWNYRMSDINAALGLSQLKKANEGVDIRREIAKRYEDHFQGKDYLLGQSGSVEGHAYHLYVIKVKDRFGLYNFLKEKGVYAQIHYIPMYKMPFYQDREPEALCTETEDYYAHCLSLPMYPSLTQEQQNFVMDTVDAYYKK